ncbi:hypothetical protein [Capnocytophaga bilenii]
MKGLKFPTPYTVLMIVIVLAAGKYFGNSFGFSRGIAIFVALK